MYSTEPKAKVNARLIDRSRLDSGHYNLQLLMFWSKIVLSYIATKQCNGVQGLKHVFGPCRFLEVSIFLGRQFPKERLFSMIADVDVLTKANLVYGFDDVLPLVD